MTAITPPSPQQLVLATPAAEPGTLTSQIATATAQPRRSARAPPADPLSDKATLFLIRRTLCAEHLNEKGKASPAPIQEALPPLTSRNDVDIQLYALLAIILRESVQSWYNKITPDQTFVSEIVQIIAHITRALEQRLRKVDLSVLLFDEIPELLDHHVKAYRVSQERIGQHPVQASPREVYHSLFPLPQLSPVPKEDVPGSAAEQAENEMAYRQLLVQGVLAVLLPTEDLENECLTSLVGQILSETIIGNIVAKKASEPWFLWEGFSILARDLSRRKNLARTEKRPSWSLQAAFWTVIHWCFVAFNIIRLVWTTVMFRSLPSRLEGREATRQKDDRLHGTPAKKPVITFKIGPCISRLLEMDSRMPWLCGVMSWVQWMTLRGPGRIAGFDGTVDRLGE